jgi:hypothetical protein
VKNADEFHETLTELRQRVETLTAERDEARRSLCECLACGACDTKMGEWFDDDGWKETLGEDVDE